MDNNFKIYTENAEWLKVLAHPVRLCIVNGLINKGECNVTNMQECLQIPQSTISQHLQKLRSAGIIEGERCGLEIKYSVVDKRVEGLIKILMEEKE